MSYQAPNTTAEDIHLSPEQPETTTVPRKDGGGSKLAAPDLETLLEAARIPVSPDLRQRAPRYGRLGACVACRQAIHAHFDAAGGFLGCPAVPEDTVFVLVPVTSAGSQAQLFVPPAWQPPTTSKVRRFRIARYVPTVPRGQQLEDLHLSEHRERVLKAVVEKGKDGTRANDVIRRSGLPHGSVQQALSWLRAQGLIEAREDMPNDGK